MEHSIQLEKAILLMVQPKNSSSLSKLLPIKFSNDLGQYIYRIESTSGLLIRLLKIEKNKNFF